MTTQQVGGGGAEDPREIRRVDPAPYAWLDGPSALRGSLPLGAHLVIGVLLAALGLYGVVTLWSRSRPGAVVFAVMAVSGVYVVRMGLLRRSWRRRHPGVDPVAASSMDEGGPVAADGVGGAVWRWLLWLVGVLVSLVCLEGLVLAVAQPGGASASDRVVGALVLGAFLVAGVLLARTMWQLMPRLSAADAALGLRPSRWGGAGRGARAVRLVVAPLAALLTLAAVGGAVSAGRGPQGDRVATVIGLAVVAVAGAGVVTGTSRRALAVARAHRRRGKGAAQ